ncbi:hypothetical protein ACWGKX_31795, partial [Streptomyces tricolor]
MAATQRIAVGAMVAAACAASLAGCATDSDCKNEGEPGPEQWAPAPGSVLRLLVDGSTSYTGSQENLPRP